MATPTWQRMLRATGKLSTQSVRGMEQLPWFAALPPQERAITGLVVGEAGGGLLMVFGGDGDPEPAGSPQRMRQVALAGQPLPRHVGAPGACRDPRGVRGLARHEPGRRLGRDRSTSAADPGQVPAGIL